MARTGTGTIPRGVETYYVTEPTVAADSFVSTVLTSDPGDSAGSATVEAVTKNAGYGFTIKLSTAAANDTTYDYIVG